MKRTAPSGPSRIVRRSSVAVAALVVAGLGLVAAPAHATVVPTTTTLTGEVLKNLSTYTAGAALPAATPMRIGVGLTVDSSARDAAYTKLFTKGSGYYHDFLTPAQFDAAFGVPASTAASVLSAITADGLQVVYDAPDGSYVELTGTAAQVDQTFHVTETRYTAPVASLATGLLTSFFANDVAPTVPTGVSGVVGLTNVNDFTEAAMTKPSQDTCEPAGVTIHGLSSGATGACLGETTPSDLWSVYDQPSTDRGAGQKVAIFGEGEVADVVSDLRTFESLQKLPTVPVKQVLVGDDLADDSGAEEWDLDSDASTGMSPDLQELDYYFGSDLSDASIGGTYSAWVNDPSGPLTGNSSFGGAEDLEYLGGFILDPILQQAAMEGRTMFASAGDVGGSCLPGANGATNTAVPCVEYPASSPYVVGVGGTVLYTNTTGLGSSTQALPATRNDEYSWNFSGGGQSIFEPAPTWQKAAFPAAAAIPAGYGGTPCLLGSSAGTAAGQSCRGVPDVSAQSGDITTNGYDIVYQGAATIEGGTSLSSPLWAGMWARVVAAHPSTCAASNGFFNAALGFAQEDLYDLGNDATQDPLDFFDVGGTTDSTPSSNGQQITLPRTPTLDPSGYDYVSGLGSPDVANIAKALDCGSTTPVASTTPVPNDDIVETYTSTAGCPSNGTISDPAGDEVPAITPNEALDLTQVALSDTTASSSSSPALTFAATVSDLAANPAGDLNYAFEFKYGSGSYAVSADRGAASSANTFELYSLAVTSTPIGLGIEVVPTALAALTGTITGNTITVTLPLATFNSTAAPTTQLAAGSSLSGITIYTNDGPAIAAIDNDFNVEPIDQAEFFQCLYTLGASAQTSLPEAPWAIGLPLVGLTTVGGVAVVRRRRRRT